MAGSVGFGGGLQSAPFVFFPLRRGGEALVLKKGQSDHHEHGMVVKAMPAPPFEVIKAEFFLHLLVALFADPARFGPGGKNRQSWGHYTKVIRLSGM
jgi:hypothetical protein